MSESLALKETNVEPQTTYLKDYHAPHWLIDEINLQFDLYDDHTLVTSFMRIQHNKSIPSVQDLILNGEELQLESVNVNGTPLNDTQYKVSDKFLILFNVPEQFELQIITKIYPEKNTELSGLYRASHTYCTQCEAEGFRRITYFMDEPDVLSRYTTVIRADKKNYPYLLSNGNLVAHGDSEDGRHWAKWEDPFKKPCYLFALVAGDFDLLEDKFITQSGKEVDLRIYVEKGFGDQSYHAMYSLKEAMRWDENVYGREYDLSIYMIVAIGDFNMGAMENKGLNIFNTKYILAKPQSATDDDYIHILSVIGHEYFHNWSGNRVTCRDWFQLSLKEGLTIFRDQSFTEDLLSRAVMRIRDVTSLRETQFPEDAGPLAHPVRPESYIEINNFYTATVYNKGAEVLRMLQTILGTSLFRKGMDLYFTRHDGQAVTIEDFIKAMEDVSGIDLQQFRLWYTQAGTPLVKVDDDYDAKQQVYTLTLNQSCLPTPQQPNKQAFDIPIRFGLLDQQGQAIALQCENEKLENEKVLRLRELSQTFHFQNIKERPIPSLLRHFSAPIKLDYNYSDADLPFLFMHDKDTFNRWEAGQKYALRVILNLAKDYRHNKPLVLPVGLVEMYENVLRQDEHDRFFLAEMLALPSEKYIGEHMDVIDVAAVHASREFVISTLANQLHSIFHDNYKRYNNPSETYQFNMGEVGKRQLKNRCLAYLSYLPQYTSMTYQQFSAALKINMTDTEAALIALSKIDNPLREQALEEFYQNWKANPLVVDKWLAIQAASRLPSTLNQVKKLLRHEAFDIKNPNKVYSLIGTFARNQINFHAENGEGYAFLREVVNQLDKINPQVAARMVKPLTTWRRYDKERQGLMREQLELLLHDKKISKDLYELVSKSLE